MVRRSTLGFNKQQKPKTVKTACNVLLAAVSKRHLVAYSSFYNTFEIVRARGLLQGKNYEYNPSESQTSCCLLVFWEFYGQIWLFLYRCQGLQGTKRALAHSQMRVGDVPGEYPSVCTGPYYRVQKKKKKKKKKVQCTL